MDWPIGGLSRHGGGGAVARKTSNASQELIENATSSSRKMRRNSVSMVFSFKAVPVIRWRTDAAPAAHHGPST